MNRGGTPQAARTGAIAIVPARLASSRLPRKMLLRETGRCLFEHTVRNVEACPAIARVLLATDSQEILDEARRAGIEAVRTSEAHRSGTDRIREAFDGLPAAERAACEVVVNVQGDEPELPAEALSALVDAFGPGGADAGSVEMATLATPLAAEDDDEMRERHRADPNVVKLLTDQNGDAVYFSRLPLPARLRHVGVYAFRPDALLRFCDLPPGQLEAAERLEQLRWIEAGRRIRVVEASDLPVGIDTEVDYRLFVERRRKLTPAP